MARKQPAEERFWSKVDMVPVMNGCWNWEGRPSADGYSALRVGDKMVKAHRFSYELLVGPIPTGLQVDHLCRNRGCVNPAHLEPVTQRENIRRGQVNWFRKIQTHCLRGHPLSGWNVHRRADRPNARGCLTCRREAAERRKKKS